MHDSAVIDNYVRWLENLARNGVHRIDLFVAKDVRYRTPVAEGVGPDAAAAIFAAIFDDAAGVKIKISDRAAGADGHTVYLRWDRLVTTLGGQVHGLSGISEVMIGLHGKIASVIEHWDSVPPPPRRRRFGLFRK